MSFFDTVVDFFSGAADVAETVVDTVVDTVEDAVDVVVQGAETVVEVVSDAACNTGIGVLCSVANIVGGVVTGVFRAVEGLVGHLANFVRGIGRLVGSVLRGNWWGAWNAFLDILMSVVLFVVDLVRIVLLATVASAIYDLSNRAALRQFIEERIATLFAGDANRIAELRSRIGLDVLHWGLPVPAHHHVLFMDSGNTELWKLHELEVLDLYQLAGYSDEAHKHARTCVKAVDGLGKDSALNAPRSEITRYLQSAEQFGGRVDQLRVYALTDRAAAEKMSVVAKKCHKMGIEVDWDSWTRFPVFNNYENLEIQVKPGDSGGEIHPYHFNYSTNPTTDFLRANGLRTGNWADECELHSVCVFHFRSDSSGGELNGIAKGINIQQSKTFAEIQAELAAGESFSCIRPSDRDDRCFICIQTDDTGNPLGTTTFYRDLWPHWFADYVPTHETGHWLGLCHWGHTGFQKMMVTVAPNQGSGLWDWDMIWRTYAYGFEPQFTWQDAHNTWRYILDQWAAPGRCL